MELLLAVSEAQGLQSHCGDPAGLRSPSGPRKGLRDTQGWLIPWLCGCPSSAKLSQPWWELESSPVPLKRSGPFFSCTSCFVCVTWDRGNWGRTLWVWGRSGLSLGPPPALSPHSTCAGTGSWQEKCLAIIGRLKGP